MTFPVLASSYAGYASPQSVDGTTAWVAPAGGDAPSQFILSSGSLATTVTIAVKGSSPSTYPTVAGVNGGGTNTNSTSQTVNLPASIASGDLLIAILSIDDTATLTWPGGWTLLSESDATSVTQSIYYRVADGSEGATISVTTSVSQASTNTVYRIQNYTGTPHVTAAMPTTSSVSNMYVPPCKPAWSGASLFLVAISNGTTPTVSTWPINYTDTRNDAAPGTNSVGTGTARREIDVTSTNGAAVVVVLSVDGNPSISGWPSGYSSLFQTDSPSNNNRLSAQYKIGDGTERDFTLTLGSAQAGTVFGAVVSGVQGSVEAGTSATGTSTGPNPPSLSPSWGADDTLWIAVQGNDATATTSGDPSNYTTAGAQAGGFSPSSGISAAYRQRNASSEDPDAFTISSSEQWVANTIAIRPASAGGGGTGQPYIKRVGGVPHMSRSQFASRGQW